MGPPGKPKPPDEELRALSDKNPEGMDARARSAIKRVMSDHQVSVKQMLALKVPIPTVAGTGDDQLGPMRQPAGFHPDVGLTEMPGTRQGHCPGKPEYLEAPSAFLTQQAALSATTNLPR